MQNTLKFKLKSRKNHLKFRQKTSTRFNSWNSTPWKIVETQVNKLFRQIYLIKLRGDFKRMIPTQEKIINSCCNPIASIRRVTSTNRGKKKHQELIS